MGEPASTTAAVVAGAAGISMAGVLAGIDGGAAVGALFGALIYSTTNRELPTWKRVLFFGASFVLGYLFAPSIREFMVFGFQPFQNTGFAAFAVALMLVTLSLWALERGKSGPGGLRGDQDG